MSMKAFENLFVVPILWVIIHVERYVLILLRTCVGVWDEAIHAKM